jgi:uncharacterized membrane protein
MDGGAAMDENVRNTLQGLFRWIHVVAGIAWIGHLYFFNWVNAHFAATMDADTKKKVVPELMPRALYWFRWGAAFTWITGLLLSGLVVYAGEKTLWYGQDQGDWSTPTIVMVAVTWLGFLVYDFVFAKIKDQRVAFVVGLVLVAAVLSAMANWAGWSFRGYAISLAMLFGTAMAFNVWFRIWPAQKKIIGAVKAGTPPDAALVASAGVRSKHNTFMSVPLVFGMLNAHQNWAAGWFDGKFPGPWPLFLMVAVGWWLTWHLYMISKKVKGF